MGSKILWREMGKKMEIKYANYFKVKHAIAVNSWTAGLTCAIGALDIEPVMKLFYPMDYVGWLQQYYIGMQFHLQTLIQLR